jgi:phosphoglycerate dehydrogenase-like enzyme
MVISKNWSEAWQRGLADESSRYHPLLRRWAKRKERNSAASMLESFRNRRIAIFGFGSLGVILFDELKEADITPVFIIENRLELAGGRYHGVNLIQTHLLWCNPADVVIVTPVYAFASIAEAIARFQPDTEVFSIQDLVDKPL